MKSRLKDASVVVLNFTLQFLSPDDRYALLEKIHAGLRPGGILILSEKFVFEDESSNELYRSAMISNVPTDTASSVSQKRSAIENVMRVGLVPVHKQRFEKIGFLK